MSKQTESGQGLIEYALILVLVAVVVIVILALLGPAIGNVFSNHTGDPCYYQNNKTSYACRNYQVSQCLKAEQYTRDECIALVGGGK